MSLESSGGADSAGRPFSDTPAHEPGSPVPSDPVIGSEEDKSLPDIPMARPVSISSLPEAGPSAEDISSSAVRLSPWGAAVQLVGLVAVGFLAVVVGQLLASVLPFRDPRWQQIGVTGFAGLITLLAAFAMTRSAGQRLSAIGWRVNAVASDVGIGVLAVFGVYAVMIMAAMVVTLLDPGLLERTTEAQQAIKETIPPVSVPAIIAMMTFVALWEEVVFRGFLLTRLYAVFRRWWLVVILGSSLFAVGHVYQGAVATVVIVGVGVVLGFLFIWRRSLLPPIVFHIIFNVAALLMLRSESGTWQ